MNDRELLELAAKAAGIVGEWAENYGSSDYYYQGNQDGILYELPQGGWYVWNPITDDGDALRLAVGLCFSIDQSTSVIEVRIGKDLIHRFVAFKAVNRLEATRRAIVRAAAEIGKSAE